MAQTPTLAEQIIHLFPDLDRLAASLQEELDQAVEMQQGRVARFGFAPAASGAPVHETESRLSATLKLIETGAEVELSDDEQFGLEAIVSEANRPSLMLENGRLPTPPLGWEDLERARPAIEQACMSVGRVGVEGHPMTTKLGTAFVVAHNVLMTNRHVATTVSEQRNAGEWVFIPGMVPNISYAFDPDSTEESVVSPRFTVTELLGVHDQYDLALLQFDAGDAPAPTPLGLASRPPDYLEDRTIYVMGYPQKDRRNNALLIEKIFGDRFDVKRLQPGTIMRYVEEDGLIRHDCSTLGGNSGSCVIDLESGKVIGLHFRGEYLKYNEAVALWQLREDPLLASVGIQFVD